MGASISTRTHPTTIQRTILAQRTLRNICIKNFLNCTTKKDTLILKFYRLGTIMQLINFVLPSLHSSLSGGHLNATELQAKIQSFSKGEGYYCLFDLEPRDSFKEYRGIQSPALGYFVLDFDSSEDMDPAKADCITVIKALDLQPWCRGRRCRRQKFPR